MSDYMFVDKDINIRVGEDAVKALTSTSDAEFLTKRNGVSSVPKSRWEVAQSYERNTWMSKGAHADDDRNQDHATQFEITDH